MQTRENKEIFLKSLPVAMGYLFWGLTYGLLFSEKGGSTLLAFIISLSTFAGAAQFLALQFFGTHIDEWAFFSAVFLLNFRHVFYGITALNDFGLIGVRKFYLISALTDENFALYQFFKNKGQCSPKILLKIFSLNHFYWIFACTLGCALGNSFKISIRGFDFILTAFFIVLLIENLKKLKWK